MSLEKVKERNERNLSTLSPEAQHIMREIVRRSWEAGVPVVVTDANRTQEEQDKLYAQGRTKPGSIVTRTRNSKHMGGNAIDLYPVDSKGNILWRKVGADYHLTEEGYANQKKVSEIANEYGVEWGGNWRKPDNPHFQFVEGKSKSVSPPPSGIYIKENDPTPLPKEEEVTVTPGTPTNAPPSGAPKGLPALPSEASMNLPPEKMDIDNIDVTGRNPLPDIQNGGIDNTPIDNSHKTSIAKHPMPEATTMSNMVGTLNQHAIDIGQERQDKLSELRAIQNYYDNLKFKPMTSADALAQRPQMNASQQTSLKPLWDNAQKELKEQVDTGEMLRKGNYMSAWNNVMQPGFEAYNTYFRDDPFGYKADPDFKVSDWITQNNIDMNKLGDIRDNKYTDMLRLAKSAEQAEAVMILANNRQDHIQKVEASGAATQFAMGMTTEMMAPWNWPTFVSGGAAIRAARAGGLIGRATLNGSKVASQVKGALTAEAIASTHFVMQQVGLGEVRTGSDFAMEYATGAVLAIPGSFIGARSGAYIAGEQHAQWARESLSDATMIVATAEKRADYHVRAMNELGPDTTQAELTAKISQYENEEIESIMRINLADIPDSDKIIKDILGETQEAERVKHLEELLSKRNTAIENNEKKRKLREEVAAQNEIADREDQANQEFYQIQLNDYNQRKATKSQNIGDEVTDDIDELNSLDELDDIDGEVQREIDASNELDPYSFSEDTVDPMTSNVAGEVEVDFVVTDKDGYEIELPDFLRERVSTVHTRGQQKYNLKFSNDLDIAGAALDSSRKMRAGVNGELRNLLTTYEIDYKKVSAWGRFIKKRIPEYIKEKNLKPGDTINVDDLWTAKDRKRIFGDTEGRSKVKPTEELKKVDQTNIRTVRNTFVLPKSLGNAKPAYKRFNLVFDNDYDLASYILAGEGKSANHVRYEAQLKGQGLEVANAIQHGIAIREALKQKVGEFQSGAPIDIAGLIPESYSNSILRGSQAKVVTRKQARANRLLDKEPTPPKPAHRKTLKPEDLVDDQVISLEEIQKAIGLDEAYMAGVPDIREALQLQIMSDNIKSNKGRERSEQKNKLASWMTKKYPAFFKELNPIATRLRSSNVKALRLVADMLENPTGSVFGKTAALTKHTMQKIYMGNLERKYQTVLSAYYSSKKINPAFMHIDNTHKVEFNNKLFLYQTNKANGNKNVNDTMFTPDENEMFALVGEELDRVGDVMRVSQIRMKVNGWENLPQEKVEGYLPWRVNPDLWVKLDPKMKLAYAKTMTREIVEANPEITLDEAFGIARSWVNVMDNKSTADLFITTTPFSRRGGAEVEDAINAMVGIADDQKQALLSKYRKGQLNHNKSRIQRDITTEVVDEDGNTMRLMDIMETDPIALFRNQAGRVAGEVSVKQYGINGRAGFEQLRKIANKEGATPDDIEALNQAEAELLGLPVHGNTPGHMRADTFLSAVRTMSLGNLIFAQLGEMFNALPLYGVVGTMKILARSVKLAKEAKLDAVNPGNTGNELLDELSKLHGGIGTDNYKFTLPTGDTGREFDVPYSSGNLTLLSRLTQSAENIQGKYTFFHAMLAAQQRFNHEGIIKKSYEYIMKDGDVSNKALISMGIHNDLVKKLRKEKDIFKVDENGELIGFYPLKAKDAQAVSEFNQAIKRGTGQIIQETFAGERGSWIKSPVWKFMLALRSYAVGSLQKQLGRSIDDLGAWHTAGYILASTALIVPIQVAKTYVQALGMGDEEKEEFYAKRLSIDKLLYTSMSYTAQAGGGLEILNFGMAPFENDYTTIRSGGRTSISQLSPSMGKLENAFNVPGDLVGRVNKDGERVRSLSNLEKITPFGSTPQVHSIFNLYFRNEGDDE